MKASIVETVRPALIPLEWDSAHFGFPTARLEPAELADDALTQGLREARLRRFRLVYWFASAERAAVPDAPIREFDGRLVDRKATFVADRLIPPERLGAEPCRIAEEPIGPASKRLRELAVAAGFYSRFRVDSRVPPDKFRELYEIWIDRSVRRETADSVLVAIRPEIDPEPIGLATFSLRGDEVSIGLIAVDERARGKGIGSLLMDGVHRRAIETGATRARVVTQLDNAPAVRLYERRGYRLDDCKSCYHFWL